MSKKVQQLKEICGKNHFFRLLCVHNSGIILLVVLWFLVILTILAVGLGRRTSIDLKLAQHAIGKSKAFSLAYAGLVYAMDFIQRDTQDDETKNIDTLYAMGVALGDDDTKEELFDSVPLGQGHFSLHFVLRDSEGGANHQFGFLDEESKININALTKQNVRVFINLIELLGSDQETAKTIAHAVIDWKDGPDVVLEETLGAEDEYYMGQSPAYHCKNLPFDSVDELLLVKGMTEEIFENIKDYVTVFPKDRARLSINFNTASSVVLESIARTAVGASTNTDISDAQAMVAKLIDYRRGDDDLEATKDDRVIDSGEIPFNAKERILFAKVQRLYYTKTSRFIRLHSTGVDGDSSAQSDVEAIVDRDNLSFVYWNRL